MSAKIIKKTYEKAKIACCAVASVLMGVVIILNMVLIVKLYIFKQDIPDIFGVFPLISLTDDTAPRICDGDLVFCTKTDGRDLVPGELVAYYANNSRSKISVRTVSATDGDMVELVSPNDKNSQEVSTCRIIGRCGLTVPHLGDVVCFISTIPGFLLCVVVPAIVITEGYLYFRRKNAALEEDEEALLLAELERLRAERAELEAAKAGAETPDTGQTEYGESSAPQKGQSKKALRKKKKNSIGRSRRGVRAKAKRMAKCKRKK